MIYSLTNLTIYKYDKYPSKSGVSLSKMPYFAHSEPNWEAIRDTLSYKCHIFHINLIIKITLCYIFNRQQCFLIFYNKIRIPSDYIYGTMAY